MTVPAVLNGPGTLALQGQTGVNAIRETMDTLKAIRTFIKEEFVKDLDFGVIPGTGQKPTLLQPGAQKTALYFNASPEHTFDRNELGNGHVEFVVTTRLISRSTGTGIGMGLGSCSTMESKYRYRNAARVCPDCGKEAIVKGREEYGGGLLCFAKKGGCGAKFTENDRRLTEQVVGRVDNIDIYDSRNTVLKMAVKRSLVAAALSLGCLSELFTQDIEETYDLDRRDSAEGRERDPGREAVNEQFPQRGQEGPQEARREGGTASADTWAAFIARECRERSLAWQNDMAIENVPKADRSRKDNRLPEQEQVLNHLVNRGIEAGSIAKDSVETDGKRDRTKSLKVVSDLYSRAPRKIRNAVLAYFNEKERELRVKLGMEDLDDGDDALPATHDQDQGDGTGASNVEEREPGSDG